MSVLGMRTLDFETYFCIAKAAHWTQIRMNVVVVGYVTSVAST